MTLEKLGLLATHDFSESLGQMTKILNLFSTASNLYRFLVNLHLFRIRLAKASELF